MPGRLRSRAVAPRLSRPAACFEHLIFANENRCNHQHEFLSNPAYRKFSGDCSWNPKDGRSLPGGGVTLQIRSCCAFTHRARCPAWAGGAAVLMRCRVGDVISRLGGAVGWGPWRALLKETRRPAPRCAPIGGPD